MSEGMRPERPILAVSLRHLDAEIVVGGWDELHVEEVFKAVCAAVCKGEERFVDSAPRVILLETIRTAAEGEGKYIRQTGGVGNYGHVRIRLQPANVDVNFQFLNTAKPGSLPSQYIEPIRQGILGAMRGGILRGYEMVGIKATLIGGSYHETDSNDMAFQIAASMAFKEAARKAGPVLVEPIMDVEVLALADDVGAAIGDINSRRGRIESVENHVGMVEIKALVPLRELLRSSRHGRPVYPMTFASYQPVLPSAGGLEDDGAAAPVRNPVLPKSGQGAEAVPLRFEHNSTTGLN